MTDGIAGIVSIWNHSLFIFTISWSAFNQSIFSLSAAFHSCCSNIFSNFFPFCSLFRSTLFTVRCFPFSFFPLPASCQRIIESQHSAPLQANKKESRSAATEQSKEKLAEGEGAKRRCSRQFHSQPPGRYEVRTSSKVKSQQSIINRRNDDWINKWMIAGLLLQERESFCGPVSTLTRMLRSSEWMSYSWLMPPTNSLFVVGSNTWNPSNSFPF